MMIEINIHQLNIAFVFLRDLNFPRYCILLIIYCANLSYVIIGCINMVHTHTYIRARATDNLMNRDDCMLDVSSVAAFFAKRKISIADKLNREKSDRIETVANFPSNRTQRA